MSIGKDIQTLRRFSLSRFSRINVTPIIILGNQKSGTTVIAVLLAECTGSSVTLDIQNIAGVIQTKIRSRQIAFSDFVKCNKHEFSRTIIKEPCLTFLYPQVQEFFQAAKYVMIVRDPRDNIRSILNRLNIRGDLEDISWKIFSTIPPGWQVIVDNRWLGLHGDTYIEMLAERWSHAADVYLQHSEEMILIRYEDFIADKAGTIEQLARQLGLAPINNIADKVNIQYQPKGNHDITWQEFFGYDNLMRIERICGTRMLKFGYPL